MIFLGRFRFYRNALLIILAVTVTVTLMRWTAADLPGLNRVEVVLSDLMAPLQSGVMVINKAAGSARSLLETRGQLAEENKALQEQLAQLLAVNNRLKEYEMESQRLKKLLGFEEAISSKNNVLPAAVIGRDPNNWFQTITINRGSANGVRPNMPVITHQGLVGRVLDVGEKTAKVLLILDGEGAVGATVQVTRFSGVIEANNRIPGLLQMIHLPHDAVVRPNQVVVTSGLGDIFPKGLRIGYVTEVITEPNGLMKKALIQPFADFNRLEEVLVLLSVSGEE
ncbi:MAG: rod shape-determining protein MreC [Bacillota bacterium]